MRRIAKLWLAGWLIFGFLGNGAANAAPAKMRAFRGGYTVRVFAKRRPVGLRGQGGHAGRVRVPTSVSPYVRDDDFQVYPLGNLTTLAADTRGQVFELVPGAMIAGRLTLPAERAVRQPLVRGANGKLEGGLYSGLLPLTAAELEILNTHKEILRPAF